DDSKPRPHALPFLIAAGDPCRRRTPGAAFSTRLSGTDASPGRGKRHPFRPRPAFPAGGSARSAVERCRVCLGSSGGSLPCVGFFCGGGRGGRGVCPLVPLVHLRQVTFCVVSGRQFP